MFTPSFFAFLRIGEISAKSSKTHKNIIQFHNLTVDESLVQKTSLTLTLLHFKHHDSCRPVCLQISPQSSKQICPVSMVRYLEVRGNSQGPLFTFDGLSPIHQSFYTSQLKNVISFVDLDFKNYKSHSVQIGAASYAFQCKINKVNGQMELKCS